MEFNEIACALKKIISIFDPPNSPKSRGGKFGAPSRSVGSKALKINAESA
jgi:hypothetical protein